MHRIALLLIATASLCLANVILPKAGDEYARKFCVRVTLLKTSPEFVHLPVPTVQPLPQYPDEMRRDRLSGGVIVRFELDQDGSVKKWAVIKEYVPGFADSVKKAVAEWRFGPAEDYGGKPVAMTLDYEFEFAVEE